MTGRIIEIATSGRSVHLERGFINIKEKGHCIGKVPVDDIDTIVSSAQGVMWSSHAISALTSRGASIVIVGAKYQPSSIVLSCDGHHDQGKKLRAQADASLPTRKRLWADIVKAKILAQAEALRHYGHSHARLKRLALEVKSGDTSNREAIAAQAYWPLLMGKSFRRDRDEAGANAMLNYGYTILRSAAARSIVAAGLHPSLALHHVSNSNAFCLADDLMEPFRPAVDMLVCTMINEGATIEEPQTKATLANVLSADYVTTRGNTPLSQLLVRLAQDLSKVFMKEQRDLSFPISRIPALEDSDL